MTAFAVCSERTGANDMRKEILIKLRVVTVVGLPFVLLLSAVMTIMFLCGVIRNESVPYLYFAVSY